VPVAITYGGLRFEEGFRADIIVEGKVKEGIERVVNGLPEENLGVFAASRDTHIEAERDAPNAAPPHR
jgi:hypothetical protein